MRAAAEAGEAGREQVGALAIVVDAVDACVLKGHAAAFSLRVGAGGVEHLRDRIPAIERDQPLAQLVVGCVK